MRNGAAGLAICLALPVAAQDSAGAEDDFRQTAIPATVDARFVCHQAGEQILSIEGIASFAPARVQGVMTFSLRTHGEETHLIYLGATTACQLVVEESDS
jgi:hypothetical protein